MSAIQIVISEVLPDPVGRDTEHEWIELANLGDRTVSLAGFQLDDIEGGSRPYVLPSIDLAAGEYRLFSRAETKLALNNSGAEMVRLFDSTGQLVDSVDFADLSQGMALAREDDGTYRLTGRTTPGLVNDFDTQKITGQLIASDATGFTLSTADSDLVDVRYDTDFTSQLAKVVIPVASDWQVYAREEGDALILAEFSLSADYMPEAQTIPAAMTSTTQMVLSLVLVFSLATVATYTILNDDFSFKKLISRFMPT